MFNLEKDGLVMHFQKKRKGVMAVLKNIHQQKKFCVVSPGYIYIEINQKWEPLDTSPIQTDKTGYEKACYQFSHIIPLYFRVKFSIYEFLFIEALICDMFAEKDLQWVPGEEKADLIELLGDSVIAHYIDGSQDVYKIVESQSFQKGETISNEKLKVPFY